MKEEKNKNEISHGEIEKKARKKRTAQNIVAYSLLAVFSAVFIVCSVIIADYIVDNAKEGDLVITLGCGDIYKAAKIMLNKYAEK